MPNAPAWKRSTLIWSVIARRWLAASRLFKEKEMSDLLQELIGKVLQWGHDRNLTAPENLKGQTFKLVSEFGEIGEAHAQYLRKDEIDAIGDTLVVAIIISQQTGDPLTNDDIIWDDCRDPRAYYEAAGELGKFVDMVGKGHPNADLQLALRKFVKALCLWACNCIIRPDDALDHAYEQIKDRKGVMYQGLFIKEADPRYPNVMRELGKAP
jgi:hypothetical protein